MLKSYFSDFTTEGHIGVLHHLRYKVLTLAHFGSGDHLLELKVSVTTHPCTWFEAFFEERCFLGQSIIIIIIKIKVHHVGRAETESILLDSKFNIIFGH